MTKVDINYEMVIQQQREEEEARDRQRAEAEQHADEPVVPSTTWVYGTGLTEEEADLDARSKLTPEQSRAIISRKVDKPAPRTTILYGEAALEQSQKTVRTLTSQHCVVTETNELPARRFTYHCRARSRRAAAALVRESALAGRIRDPQDPFETRYRVELESLHAVPTRGGLATSLVSWLLGRRPYEAILQTPTRVAVVYRPPVSVSLHVPAPE